MVAAIEDPVESDCAVPESDRASSDMSMLNSRGVDRRSLLASLGSWKTAKYRFGAGTGHLYWSRRKIQCQKWDIPELVSWVVVFAFNMHRLSTPNPLTIPLSS